MNSPLGAHGRPATFSGPNGSKHDQIAGPLSNAGAREGGPSPMPESAKAGAFQCDESCQEYTGNPRDSAGPLGTNGSGNRVPNSGLTRSMAR